MRRQVELENPGRTVTVDSIGVQRTRVAFEYRTGLAPWIWPRFAAKVAIALLGEIMPNGSRGSPAHLGLLALFRQGLQMKGLLAGDRAVTIWPQQLGDEDYEYEALAPREHLLLVLATDSGIGVVGTLFGELRFAISIMSEFRPGEPWAGLASQSRPPAATHGPRLHCARWVAVNEACP